MKISVPIENNEGLSSRIYDHFGSAPIFLVYDLSSNKIETINNQNYAHEHGTCNPAAALGQSKVDVVICRGMGLRAINKLSENGIKVLRSDACTAEDSELASN